MVRLLNRVIRKIVMSTYTSSSPKSCTRQSFLASKRDTPTQSDISLVISGRAMRNSMTMRAATLTVGSLWWTNRRMSATNFRIKPDGFCSFWNDVACTNVARHRRICISTGNELSLLSAWVSVMYRTQIRLPSEIEKGIKLVGGLSVVSAWTRNGFVP